MKVVASAAARKTFQMDPLVPMQIEPSRTAFIKLLVDFKHARAEFPVPLYPAIIPVPGENEFGSVPATSSNPVAPSKNGPGPAVAMAKPSGKKKKSRPSAKKRRSKQFFS